MPFSLPFQNNSNFDVGPNKATQQILNIQPVYPVSLNSEWNLITRTIVPVITADWKAQDGQRWTVPLGLGIGQIMRFGHQPVNLQVAGYYNVERPDLAARWQMRLQIQFLFPK